MPRKSSLVLPEPTAFEATPHWRERAEAFLAQLANDLAEETAEWRALAATTVAPITDDAGETAAKECLKTARAAARDIDDRRRGFTAPLHDVKTRIDALFKPAHDAAASLEAAYRRAMNAYETAREDARREAMRQLAQRAADEATAKVGMPPEMAPTVTIPAPPAVDGVQARRVWRFEVADADAVPRDLCSPDPAKIRARGPGETPGVRWWEESNVTVR